jgi:hypothetical protein
MLCSHIDRNGRFVHHVYSSVQALSEKRQRGRDRATGQPLTHFQASAAVGVGVGVGVGVINRCRLAGAPLASSPP